MDTITTGGLSMPKLGLGTWRMKGEDCVAAIDRALGLGYRHLDTAEMYGNEEAVGAGLARTGLPRDQVHVTTKVWWEHLAPDAIRTALAASLERLGTGYVDLYLIHWPAAGMDLAAALGTMAELQRQGLIRAIGVSNFSVALLRQAAATGVPIACNQVEYHVLLSQAPLLAYTRAHGIAVTAYCPLAQGRLAEYPALHQVAQKHGATPAQIALAWLLEQDGVGAIPKAARPESQQANLDAARLALDDADRAAIAALPKAERFVNPSWAPAWD